MHVHSLHSADDLQLVVPRTGTDSVPQLFSISAPSIWNALPSVVRLCHTLPTTPVPQHPRTVRRYINNVLQLSLQCMCLWWNLCRNGDICMMICSGCYSAVSPAIHQTSELWWLSGASEGRLSEQLSAPVLCNTDMSSSYKWTFSAEGSCGLLCFYYVQFIRAWISYFLFSVFPVCYCLVVSTSAIDCLERLVSEMTCYVSSGMLNPTHSLTHSATTTTTTNVKI